MKNFKIKIANKNLDMNLPKQSIFYRWIFAGLVLICMVCGTSLSAQNETMSAGSFIINMGVANQTTNNAIRPYGMVYDLTKNHQVPIRWAINPNKGKDQNDFMFNGVGYRGGTFIIPAEFRTAAVNARISYWQGQGVVGVTTNDTVTVPVYAVIGSAVRWTLDQQNGKLAIPYLDAAQIPNSAYGYKNPQSLNQCDDLYIMPHAEPKASTHSNLVTWNNVHKGSIWVGCKAGSELDINVGKFLTVNGAQNSKAHPDLQGGVTYAFPAEPVMQFLGTGAHLASANGAEQIYYPLATGWRPTTKVGIYQTSPVVAENQRRGIIVWGRGFGDPNRGWVGMQAGHKLNDSGNNSISAMRAFHNFSLLAAITRTVYPVLTGVPDVIVAGSGTPFSYTLQPPGGSFTTQWTSSCGGTFSPNATSANVTYTPPPGATSCVISVRITDACGRVFFSSKIVTVQCVLNVSRTVTNVSCFGGTNGAINMTITGSSGPYSWNWSRVSPAGTGSGTGNTISGLTAGSYNVTVTSPAGCQATFTNLVSQPNILAITPTVTNYVCFGQTGAISLNVTGGTTPRTYSWTGPGGFTSTLQNISNLTAGTYNVTVTDANNCTGTATATVTGPSSGVSVNLASKTNVSCNGGNNGAINITAVGGTPNYTYSWNDGPTSEDRTGLVAGTYIVTVTDANGCTATRSESITQPALLVVSLTKTDPTCPPGSNLPFSANGTITVSVSGGTPNYTYSWSDGPTTQNRTGLQAGTYTVTVTDANGCTAMQTITLINLLPVPSPPTGIGN
jgi:hypothetical protein